MLTLKLPLFIQPLDESEWLSDVGLATYRIMWVSTTAD